MKNNEPKPKDNWFRNLGILAVIVAIAGALYYFFHDSLTLQALSSREQELREFQAEHPLLVYVIVFAVYVLVTALSLPFAAPMSLVIGWYFGFWRGLFIVSFASTLGATLAFLITRYLLRDMIQTKFGKHLKSFNEALDREGAFYLFTLRLIPAVPFFVINAVMGLTRIRVFTFWWVSQLGMLAGTCLYIYAGSTIPSLEELASPDRPPIISWQMLAAFAALGLFPIAAKKLTSRWRQDQVIRDDELER